MQIIKSETAARKYLKCDGQIKALCVSERPSHCITVCACAYILVCTYLHMWIICVACNGKRIYTYKHINFYTKKSLLIILSSALYWIHWNGMRWSMSQNHSSATVVLLRLLVCLPCGYLSLPTVLLLVLYKISIK